MANMSKQQNGFFVLWRQAALFFLPLTALHLGFNFSLGDFFFFSSAFASVAGTKDYHKPVVWMALLTSLLLSICTVVMFLTGEATGSLIDWIQALVIFAIVVPIGWCALKGLTTRQVFLPLFFAAIVNATAVFVQISFPSAYLPTQSEYGMAEFGLRPLGLTGNPNGLGLLMVWMIPIGVSLGANSKNSLSALGWACATIFIALAGMLSFSKAALVGIPMTLLMSQLFLGRRNYLLGGILVLCLFILLWFFQPQVEWLTASLSYRIFSPDSFTSRLDGVLDAWANIGEWVLFGSGPGRDNVYGEGIAQIHNQVFGFLVQFGIFSALAFCGLKTLLGIEALRILKHPSLRVVGLIFLVAEVSLLVHPVYWTRAHYLPVLLLLWECYCPQIRW